MTNKKTRKYLIAAVVVFLLSGVSHLRVLRNYYVLDDFRLILTNDFISDINNARIILSPRHFLVPYPFKCGARPLTVLSLMIDHKIWGKNPFGYHLTNLLLHSFNSVLIFMLALFLFKKNGEYFPQDRQKSNALAISFMAACVFAVHPVQAEVINIASFRADLLTTFLYLFSLVFFVTAIAGKTTGSLVFYALALLAFILGLFSKEIAVTLPVVLFMYVFLFRRKKLTLTHLLTISGLAVLSIGFLVFFWSGRISYQLYSTIYPNIAGNMSPLSGLDKYVNTLLLSFLHYVKTLLFPFWLAIDYELNVSGPVFGFGNVLAVAVLALLALLFVKTKNQLVKFGLGFAFISYIPVSNIIPLINTINDRYMYLPMAGFSVLVPALISDISLMDKTREKLVKISLSVLIILVYGWITVQRNPLFYNGYSLYSDAMKRVPDNIRVRYNYAIANMVRGDFKEAIDNFSFVDKKCPLYKKDDMWHLMGICYERLGEHENARRYYVRQLFAFPRKKTLNNLAGLLLDEGNDETAYNLLKTSIEILPDRYAYNDLGVYYARKRKYGKAREYFNKSLEFEPQYVGALINLINLARTTGDKKLLQEQIERISAMFPGGGMPGKDGDGDPRP
ncbi:MAG: tetratricopeptide repeat protein [Endomicrobiales bacterium]|nr:tetratricopeptide repeat protein [Endomicrobiales bacterium]